MQPIGFSGCWKTMVKCIFTHCLVLQCTKQFWLLILTRGGLDVKNGVHAVLDDNLATVIMGACFTGSTLHMCTGGHRPMETLLCLIICCSFHHYPSITCLHMHTTPALLTCGGSCGCVHPLTNLPS